MANHFIKPYGGPGVADEIAKPAYQEKAERHARATIGAPLFGYTGYKKNEIAKGPAIVDH